jgi:hypothetical protein
MTKLLLLLFTGAKFGKLLLTGGSMLVSVFAYALLFGWRYAVGFVLLLFVHEMGHYIAARQRGLDVGAPTFIPFVGAWVELKDMPHDAETEAYVGLGGPLLGTPGRAGLLLHRARPGQQPAAGDRLRGLFPQPVQPDPAVALRRRAHHRGAVAAHLVAGSAGAGGAVLLAAEPLLILMAVLAAPQLLKAIRYKSDSEEAQTYYAVSAATRFEYGFYYLALAGFLAVMTHDVHEMLRGVAGIR